MKGRREIRRRRERKGRGKRGWRELGKESRSKYLGMGLVLGCEVLCAGWRLCSDLDKGMVNTDTVVQIELFMACVGEWEGRCA